MQLMPAKALVIRQGQELEIPVEELVVGEEIVVVGELLPQMVW